ncbi:hypothetical protein DICPUDRAFT_148544 [Dictyostelium purpureum]|uniref:Uncharacterized protein n=1 Tax=Dictyostelium purpureum TaxID=5786 RepID=F0ZBE4_DICPU|nr:uncharacterized protein DICPUDRAFT_148544 [Dictyostelium purpureum]EGC38731.1 hypothetical protein DICPUDRAFT_148544 [Dictyostelium purpureum]|eukprot:XP_003284722.1 hypothetical protein DICPUDRAFT_148544 [Dictyostelium purpureum]
MTSNKINKETFCLIEHINKLVLDKIKEQNQKSNNQVVKSKNQIYDPTALSPFAFYLTKELTEIKGNRGEPKTLEQFDNLTLEMILSCAPRLRPSKNIIKLL